MPWSKLDIINLAMNKLNKSSVDDLVNAGVFAESASRVYDMLYPSKISGFSWRFATKTVRMSVLVTPPPIARWSYALQLPSDYLAAVRTYPRMDFQIFEDQMWTNNNIVDLEYRFIPDETHLPAYFIDYFVLVLASWFANAVCEDDNLAKSLLAEAQDQLGQSLFTDSQSHPISPIQNNPIIQSRYSGWDTWDIPGNPQP